MVYNAVQRFYCREDIKLANSVSAWFSCSRFLFLSRSTSLKTDWAGWQVSQSGSIELFDNDTFVSFVKSVLATMTDPLQAAVWKLTEMGQATVSKILTPAACLTIDRAVFDSIDLPL